MEHPVHRVVEIRHLGEFRIEVAFEDGTSQEIDFSPVLRGEMYGPLRDPKLFEQVEIDPEVHTLVWPNGADFDPATLHDWPRQGPAMARLAESWATSDSSFDPQVASQLPSLPVADC